MAEQAIDLDGADSADLVVPNANDGAGDSIDQGVVSGRQQVSMAAAAAAATKVTLANARDVDTIRYRVLNELRRSKPIRSVCPLWKYFMVYVRDSLPGIAVCRLCEANGDIGDAEVRYSSPTHLRQHLDTKRKGHREALNAHEAAGANGSGSGGAASGKDGTVMDLLGGVKPFTRKMIRFVIDSHQPFSVSALLMYVVRELHLSMITVRRA